MAEPAGLILERAAGEAVENAILISGAARSGTSMMGQLIHSLEGVEYSFEPPMLFALMPLIDSLPPETFRFLLEAYLFEDFMVEALAGRRINLNENDLSCIRSAKRSSDVDMRLGESHGRVETIADAARRRLAFKMPDILPFLPALARLYPGMTILVMTRRPEAVIASLRNKAWYGSGLSGEAQPIWPRRRMEEREAPFWVPAADIAFWDRISELERCCYYYVLMYRSALALEGAILISYEKFVADPLHNFEAIAARLKLGFGALTPGLLNGVAEPERKRAIDLTSVEDELRRSVEDVASAIRIRHDV